MRLIKFTRGISFRIAALTTALLLVSMATLGVFVYSFVDSALQARVRLRIEEEVARLLASTNSTGGDRLIAEITRRTRAYTARRYAYRVTTSDGTHVAGDFWIKATPPGWTQQEAPDEIEPNISGGHVLVLTVPVQSDLVLSIARDIHWVTDVEDELVEILLWALLGGVALAAMSSFIAHRVMARRVEIVTGSALAIMDGNLKHRVPLTGAGDDFDRLSQTLNGMLDRIQGLMENLEQVTNDIAHDLRTPLGRLRQGLDEARRKATSTEGYERAIEHAIAEADGLLSTFTALLRIAQVEAGARRSAFRTVDLSEVIRSIFDAYELSAEEAGYLLKLDVPDGIEVSGDRDLLVQMFSNLIENALTHTPRGSAITVSLSTTASGIVAAVADNGPGVPDADREAIFRRFFRGESSRTTPGTGLGLSLVAAVAKLHGARLQADDNRPGLRIGITFPTRELP